MKLYKKMKRFSNSDRPEVSRKLTFSPITIIDDQELFKRDDREMCLSFIKDGAMIIVEGGYKNKYIGVYLVPVHFIDDPVKDRVLLVTPEFLMYRELTEEGNRIRKLLLKGREKCQAKLT